MYVQANLRSRPSIEIPNSYARSRSSLARVSCFAGTSIYLGSRRDFWLWAGWFPICIRPCATVQLGLRHCTNGAGGGATAAALGELSSLQASKLLRCCCCWARHRAAAPPSRAMSRHRPGFGLAVTSMNSLLFFRSSSFWLSQAARRVP